MRLKVSKLTESEKFDYFYCYEIFSLKVSLNIIEIINIFIKETEGKRKVKEKNIEEKKSILICVIKKVGGK